MIGNDIVDLALAQKESNWRRRGFIDKIFTKEEKKLIYESQDHEQMVWHLWSRKEAAYKIYNRYSKEIAYIPHLIECSNIESNGYEILGKVVCKGQSYYTLTHTTSEFIYSVATINRMDLNKIEDCEYKIIGKDLNGVPFNNINNNPVSITHHGRFKKIIQLKCES